MKESEEYNEKLQQWLEGQLSEEEWSAFKATNPQHLATVERIARHSAELDVPQSAKTPDQIWQQLQQRIDTNDPTPVIPLWKRRSFWVAAASAFIISMLWLNWPVATAEVYSAMGQTVDHQLPDRSRVVLNADSRIVYNEDKFLKERSLTLEGEAYFEVESGSKFIVQSDHGMVEVLGTAFNVHARQGEFEVVCAEGSVQVTVPGGAPVVLQAGDGVALMTNQLVFTEDPNIQQVLAWQQGTFYFQNTALPMVIEELERQFDYTIQYPASLQERRYTGFFTRDNYQDALASVFEPMGLRYQVEGKVVVVE